MVSFGWTRSFPSLSIKEINDLLFECKYAAAALSYESTLLLQPIQKADESLSPLYDMLKQKAQFIQNNGLGLEVVTSLSASLHKDHQAGSRSSGQSRGTERRNDEYKSYLQLVSRVVGPSYLPLLRYAIGTNKIASLDIARRVQLVRHLQSNSESLFCPSLLEKDNISTISQTPVHPIHKSLSHNDLELQTFSLNQISSSNEAGNSEYSSQVINALGPEDHFLEGRQERQGHKRKYIDETTHVDTIPIQVSQSVEARQIEVNEATTTGRSRGTLPRQSQLPSLHEMALIGPAFDRDQSQAWNYNIQTSSQINQISSVSASSMSHLEMSPSNESRQIYTDAAATIISKMGTPLNPKPALYNQHREIKYVCTNAPASDISKLSEPFRAAVMNSRLWKWERAHKIETTGCLSTLFPKNNEHDVTLTIFCGNEDGYVLNDYFGLITSS